MLRLAVVPYMIACSAAFLGFGGVAALSWEGAKILVCLSYHYAKSMSWPNVGRRYLEFFTQIGSDREAFLTLRRNVERRVRTSATRAGGR